jgi:hypothetical protein
MRKQHEEYLLKILINSISTDLVHYENIRKENSPKSIARLVLQDALEHIDVMREIIKDNPQIWPEYVGARWMAIFRVPLNALRDSVGNILVDL